jgi:hypothetical protein
MEGESLISCLKEPVTGHYLEPVESSPQLCRHHCIRYRNVQCLEPSIHWSSQRKFSGSMYLISVDTLTLLEYIQVQFFRQDESN